MAGAPWTARVRERAFQAHTCIVQAHGQVSTAAAQLALPMQASDAQGGRTRSLLLRGMLDFVSSNLSFSGSVMTAAELLARCGGAADPTTPLPSIDYLPGIYHHVRLALGLLQCARICAEHTCDAVEECRGYLHVVYSLLDQPDLHGVDGFVDAQRVAAHGHLQAAQDLAEVSATFANIARSLLER